MNKKCIIKGCNKRRTSTESNWDGGDLCIDHFQEKYGR